MVTFPLPAFALIIMEAEIDRDGLVKTLEEKEYKPFEEAAAQQKNEEPIQNTTALVGDNQSKPPSQNMDSPHEKPESTKLSQDDPHSKT